MITKLYSDSYSGIKDLITKVRRYEDLETRLQMSEFEQNQTASTMFILPTLLAAMIPTTAAWLLVPAISKLMGISADASIFANPIIPVVLAVVLSWTYIGQRIVLRRLEIAHLSFVTVMTSIAAFGGWSFYLLKLKIEADPDFLSRLG